MSCEHTEAQIKEAWGHNPMCFTCGRRLSDVISDYQEQIAQLTAERDGAERGFRFRIAEFTKERDEAQRLAKLFEDELLRRQQLGVP